MKLIKKNNKKGFTLVELIVVIAILAILALILVPAITKYVDGANKSKNEANVRSLYSEAMLIKADNPNLDEDGIKQQLSTDALGEDATVTVNLSEDGAVVESVTLEIGNDKPYTYPDTKGDE